MNNYLIPRPISTQFSLKMLFAAMTYICFVLAFFKLIGEVFLAMSYWIFIPYYTFYCLFLFINLWTYNHQSGIFFRNKYWPKDETFNSLCVALSHTYMFVSLPAVIIIFVNIYGFLVR